jgi:hypothetical protein
MTVKKLFYLGILPVLTLFHTSCGRSMQDSTSTVQHSIDGWPRLSASDFTCKNTLDADIITSINNMVYFTRDGDQDYLRYQDDHLKILLKGSKNILPPWLTFDQFCVGAPSNIRFQINGLSAKNGSIAVFQGTLLSANEKVFAAIMAHELGHILGQKLTVEQFAEQKKTKDGSPLSSDEFKANWDEQAADEIGLELYLRAGWPLDGFISMFKAMDHEEEANGSPDKNAQDKTSETNQSEACIRGTDTHPNVCWRIANAQKEYQDHKNDYSKWRPRVTIFENLGSRHKTLQETYKKLQLDQKNKPSSYD